MRFVRQSRLIGCLTMALQRYFKPVDDVLPFPMGHLSSSVSPVTIKGRGQQLALNAKTLLENFRENFLLYGSRCRGESACYHTKCQQIRKRCSVVLKVEISSAKFFCSTSHFLPHDSSPDAFVIVRTSTQKRKTSFLLHKLASSLHCSVSLFSVRMWDVVIN